MKVQQLQIKNFRCISKGTVKFPGHTALIGGNSVGKSTICDALDLLLGPDRLARNPPIDEHDFLDRQYLDTAGEPILIEMEVVLSDLTSEVQTKFRNNQEYWNTTTANLLTETACIEDVDRDDVVPVLRIKFEGWYDIEEDEFKAETFFASPPPDDELSRARISRAAKRMFGFIYLRAIRTGTRALSLERGSLLDVILKLKDDDRSSMWEETLRAIEELKPAIDEIPQLEKILDEIDTRVRSFVGLSDEERTFQLFATALTRESLRRSITLFGLSERSNRSVPYWRLGSGVVNSIIFALLTFIAELKSNVIFAMEEPEVAIPPHTQRRIVQFLQSRMDQSILTTHSPFVLEQYDPSGIVLLNRDREGAISSSQIEVAGIKAKTYRGHLRRVFAEALLGNGVLCVEGISDSDTIQSASVVLEKDSDPVGYMPLDLLGVTVVQCEGDNRILDYGKFFRNLGFKTYAIFDRQTDDAIRNCCFDSAWELEQKGIENLLADETSIPVLRNFLIAATDLKDYPYNPRYPKKYAFDCKMDETELRKLCKKVLRARKGAGYAQKLVEFCHKEDLPKVLVEALEYISQDMSTGLTGERLDGDEELIGPNAASDAQN